MNYGIIKIEELSKLDFSELNQTSAETCRYSLDRKFLIISFKNNPSFFNEINFENILGKELFTAEQVLAFPDLLPKEVISNWIKTNEV